MIRTRTAAALFLSLTFALAAPAGAVTVVTTDGRRLEAERVYPTVTALVVIQRDDLIVIPTEQVETVDGAAYEAPASAPMADPVPAASAPARPPAEPAATEARLPLEPGRFWRYAVTGTRTTWERRGQQMIRSKPEAITGTRELRVTSRQAPDRFTLRVIEQTNGRQVVSEPVIHVEPDGYYLSSDRTEQLRLLLPRTYRAADTWHVAPYARADGNRLEKWLVTGLIDADVPAGRFKGAQIFVGDATLLLSSRPVAGGRLVTDNGTEALSVRYVPGLGPVQVESTRHVHQTFFPEASTSGTARVEEVKESAVLVEYGPGARP